MNIPKFVAICLLLIIIIAIPLILLWNHYRYSVLSSEILEIKKRTMINYPRLYYQSSTQMYDERINEIYLSLTENNLKTTEALITSVRWSFAFVLTVISVVIAILGLLGFKYFFPTYINARIKEWIEGSEEIKTLKKDLGESYKQQQFLFSKTYVNDGLSQFKKGNVERAIEHTVKSLEFAKNSFRDQLQLPKSKDEELLWGYIHGNLGYYYARLNNIEKYTPALECAKIALAIGTKYNRMALIEDYLYIIKQYKVEKKGMIENAKLILESYKDQFQRNQIIKEEEIRDYEQYFEETQ